MRLKSLPRASGYRDEGNDEADPEDERANLVDGSDGTLSDLLISADPFLCLNMDLCSDLITTSSA
jgi:hypothetical protein